MNKARPSHICTGTGLILSTSAPGLGSLLPTSTPGLGLTPAHICTGAVLAPVIVGAHHSASDRAAIGASIMRLCAAERMRCVCLIRVCAPCG